MRFILSLLLSVITLNLPAADDPGPPYILVLGDSLSAGYGMDREQSWVHLFGQRLEREGYRYRILNSSISGDTTQGGLARIGRLLERYQPAIVIIELGGNDGLRGIDPDVSLGNMASMIEQSQRNGARVLLAGIRLPPNYGSDYLQKFEPMYANLASEYGTLLVPFFMEGVVFTQGMMQPDGIHPSVEAQPVLLDNVWKILQPELQSMTAGRKR